MDNETNSNQHNDMMGTINKETNSNQHNDMMEAINEAVADLSGLEKDIFYMLLDKLRDDDPEGKKYRIDLATIEQRFGTKTTIPELMEATKGFLSRGCTVKEKEGDESDFIVFSLVDSVKSHLEDGSIELKINPVARPYLLELKKTLI